MSKAVVIDVTCPKPYSTQSLKEGGLGGTEATVIRIADKMDLEVRQHNRTEWEGNYGPLNMPEVRGSHPLIVLRAPDLAIELAKAFKNRKVFLWLHDLVRPEIGPKIKALYDAGVRVLFVSGWQRGQFLYQAKVHSTPPPPSTIVYNPVDDTWQPDQTAVDPYKLLFTSSPHKGLENTLECFKKLHRIEPRFRLHILNPGYHTPPHGDWPEGVVDLGTLPHHEVMSHVRSALCLFYLNHVFPETFGLVLAEANAVGTPVLTHSIGAAPEVLDGSYQLIDTRDHVSIIDRILKWADAGRPKVALSPDFRMSNVLKAWRKLLD